MNRLELTDFETEQLREAILTLPIGRYAPIINAVLTQLPETDRVAANPVFSNEADRTVRAKLPHGDSL